MEKPKTPTSVPPEEMEKKLEGLFFAMEKRKEELAKENEDKKLEGLRKSKSLWWEK